MIHDLYLKKLEVIIIVFSYNLAIDLIFK